MTLYHYTCHHRVAAIGLHRGQLELQEGQHIIWLTDTQMPVPSLNGLSIHKAAHRYRVVDETDVVPWIEFRKTLPEEVVFEIELQPHVAVQHWWVATKPVPVIFDPIRH